MRELFCYKYSRLLLNKWYVQQKNYSDIYSQYDTEHPTYSLFQRSDKRLLLFSEQKYKIVRYESYFYHYFCTV